MPSDLSKIAAYARRIFTAIDDDIVAGTVPASVRSLADLRTYVDTND